MTVQSTLPTDVGSQPTVHPLVLEQAEGNWDRKERGCAENDHHDIVPEVTFYKDGELIMSALPLVMDRDRALCIADIGALTMHPDLIVVSVDAHVTAAPINPKTGEQWGPGEMQAACDTDGACATGLLTDCISTIAVFADGHGEMLSRSYTGHEKAGGLTWQEPTHYVGGNGVTPTGYVQERLNAAMETAQSPMNPLRTALEKEGAAAGINEVERYWHGVVSGATIMLLSTAACGVFCNPPTDEAKAICATYLTQDAVMKAAEGSTGLLSRLLAERQGLQPIEIGD